MLRSEEIKAMVVNDANFRAGFRELLRGAFRLYEFQAQTDLYYMSPEQILMRRETELVLLSGVVGQIVRLNRISGRKVLDGFIEGFNEVPTKWRLVDEAREFVVGWIAEDKNAIRYFSAA